MELNNFPDFIKRNAAIKKRLHGSEERLYEGKCKVSKGKRVEYIEIGDRRNLFSKMIGINPKIKNKDKLYGEDYYIVTGRI